MKKEELKSLLGLDEDAPQLGPIEATATERELPDFAIGLCTLRIEESAPAIRAVLARAAVGDSLSDDEAMLLLRGLHILGGARDSQACKPLLRLLHRPDVDELLGDTITETLAQIVAGVFDGDVDALFGAIADRSLDEFIRRALLGAATFLAWDGRIEPDRMRQFLEDFYNNRLAKNDDHAWIGWLEAIALLGLRGLAPLVHCAWDEGRVPKGVLNRSHFEGDLAEAERAPRDIDRFERANLGYIKDVLKSLDWARGWEDEDERQYEEQPEPDSYRPSTPFVNPLRNVGRNDPCPCGSGKKAKKCCLAA